MKPVTYGCLLTMLGALLSLSSCGDDSLGGGIGEFKTVTVTAQAKTTRLESDVLKGNTCSATGSTGGTYVTDLLDVTIASTPYANISNPLNIALDKYTIKFIPTKATTPALDDVVGSIQGTQIKSGSSTTLSIAVVPDILKYKLVNEKGLQLCSATMYEYFAIITFEGVEIGTGVRKGIETSLNVAIADRASTT